MNEAIPHLSLAVSDLADAREFYVDGLGCAVGRESETALDVWFYGLQLTLNERPGAEAPEHSTLHFGATLSQEDFDALDVRVEAIGGWSEPVLRLHLGEPREVTKGYLTDPAGHSIEIKVYRDREAALGADRF